jgi:hypothetical protein
MWLLSRLFATLNRADNRMHGAFRRRDARTDGFGLE